MYSYHNRITQRIKNNELIGYEFVEDYKGQGERLCLYFETEPTVRPIRQHSYFKYKDITK